MAANNKEPNVMPVVANVANFDKSSGTFVERIVFNHRLLFVVACLLTTVVLAFQASRVVVNADFDKVIPSSHPHIQNYFENRGKLANLGNAVRVVVENPNGSIFDHDFLELTRKINEEIFLIPGVDRSWMRSIWMSSVRWTEVTEEGFRGGTVMPESYDGSPRSMEELRRNLRSAGVVGDLVGADYRSVMMVVPILPRNPETGERLNYREFAESLESIRARYESPDTGPAGNSVDRAQVKIYIVGFAKIVGDLIDGLEEVMLYFVVAALIVALIIYFYTRCIRSTFLVILCSLIAVTWQLGIVSALGFELDPYSILVPFLIFAVGVSHAAQKMNGIMQDVARGTHKYVAARYTFRRLFMAGLTALLADAVGFAVLVIIDVPVIKDLALTASIGVAVLILTNLLLMPVLLSYLGVSKAAAHRALAAERGRNGQTALQRAWGWLERLTARSGAIAAITLAVALTAVGAVVALELKVGDLDAGAPELKPDSRYNRDVAYINEYYRLSGDQFVVMVKTPDGGCETYQTLKETERLGWALQQVPGVQHTTSLADNVIRTIAGLNEGNPKWLTISRNPSLIGGAVNWTVTDNPEVADAACSMIPVIAYLEDHKAETLDRVVEQAERFASLHDTGDRQFLLAAGSAGIEAVTNMVVRESILKMYAAVYGAVALLCFIAFRSWRAVVVALIPLIITSILSKALMVVLGIGLKVATLPVIALGVGIGVDYSLYLLSVQLVHQRTGLSLREAYRRSLDFTGKVVALVGITLAAGVVTWVWSPIKFQADMGVLLTFMFLWNMVGALILIPALSFYILPRLKVREKLKRNLSPGPLRWRMSRP